MRKLADTIIDRNSLTGVAGTVVTAAFLQSLQDELVNIVVEGGSNLNSNDRTQVIAKIKELDAAAVETALSTIRGNVDSDKDTLKKLLDWVITQLDSKAGKDLTEATLAALLQRQAEAALVQFQTWEYLKSYTGAYPA